MGNVRRLGLGLLCGIVLSGCVSGAPNDTAYNAKAASTAAAAASEVATVQLTAQLLIDQRLPQNYAKVTISASEDSLSAVSESFEVVQPPDAAADQVRAQLVSLLDEAEDAVAAARIASRRNDPVAMSATLAPLDQSVQDLQAVEESLQ